jgi:glutamyl-tRNA synthetase
MTVCTRVAPSPTGDPHVGTAYVSLFNWAWARRNGGRFILRIEDTDRARSKAEHETAIIDALAWLGIEADESPAAGGDFGPYRQSERGAIYTEHVDLLIAKGAAYRCFCTPERLAALREEQKKAKADMGYDGLCRGIDAEQSATRAASETHVVRLAVDKAGKTAFTDLLRGEIEIPNASVDDQVLLKSDGMPTYHLANVVDDHLMGVSIIMRAEEWIPSVPKHVMLYRAFGWEPPVFAHVPLLRNADKSKISKRKNPTSILWYRDHGFLPEALVNFLALQGWSPKDDQEEFPLDEFVARFDPKDISVGGPVFDMTKLEWVNGEKIRKLGLEELADRLRDGGFAGDWNRDGLLAVLPMFQERLKTLAEFEGQAAYLTARPEPDMEGLAKKTKKADPGALAAALRGAADLLEGQADAPEQEREDGLRALAETHELKVGALFMGLRVAVTGSIASPPLLPSVDHVGAAESAERIRSVAGQLAPAT